MVLYFSSFINKDINLFFSFKVLTYPLVDNIKNNGLMTSSKYTIEYLEILFVSIIF